MAQGANGCSGVHPFEMEKQGDVRKETTAAALRGLHSWETTPLIQGMFSTPDPSNYIRHQGQASYVELVMYEKC